MIAYDADGATLFFISPAGAKVSRTPLDGQAYEDLLMVMDAQRAAVQTNKEKRDQYVTEIANAQVSIDAGRPPAVISAPPSMLVVDDYGKSTKVPFVPALPVLHYPTTTGSTGSGKVDVPDKQAIMYNMILAMFKKMFPGA